MCRLQFGQSPLSHSFPVCANSCKNLFAFFILCATFILCTLWNLSSNSAPNVTIKCFRNGSKVQVFFFQWDFPLDEWKWVTRSFFSNVIIQVVAMSVPLWQYMPWQSYQTTDMFLREIEEAMASLPPDCRTQLLSHLSKFSGASLAIRFTEVGHLGPFQTSKLTWKLRNAHSSWSSSLSLAAPGGQEEELWRPPPRSPPSLLPLPHPQPPQCSLWRTLRSQGTQRTEAFSSDSFRIWLSWDAKLQNRDENILFSEHIRGSWLDHGHGLGVDQPDLLQQTTL